MLADPPGLRIDLVPESDAALLCLSGELDADSAGGLVEAGERAVSEGHRRLIVDCANVTFCDSFGLRALLLLWEAVGPDGSVTVAHPSATLVRILDLTGVGERFRIVPDAG